MTTSLAGVLRGAQRPRVSSVPPYHSSAGDEAVELAADAGLILDDWQQYVLRESLGERVNGTWAAFEVGLIVSRQNGKGAILEARELAGLFLFGERLILHTAHEFKTAQEAFRRVLALIEGNDDLRKRVARVRTSHGEEGVELKDGARLRFIARSGGSGRGFSGDTIILDEAMILGANAMGALLPTLSARPNPQLWYTASAGLDTSEQLRRIRERGVKGGDPSLAYFEWSAPDDADLDDRVAWRAANPALGPHISAELGIRITEEFVARERATLPEVEFGRERLGIWEDVTGEAVIPPSAWADTADRESQVVDPVAFAVDVSPDRSTASIAIAGRRADGLSHGEVVDNRSGTGWVVDRLIGLSERWQPVAILLEAASPAGSLIPALAERGIEVQTVGGREMTQACGAFFDAVTEKRFRHIDQPVLTSAVEVARRRPLGDAWAWHRKNAMSDITPLVAVTLALHGHAKYGTDPNDGGGWMVSL